MHVSPALPTPRRRPRRWRRLLLKACLLALIIPVLQVLWLRAFNPLFTWTMVGVARDHHAATGTWAWPAYEPRPLTALGPTARLAVASEDGLFWHHHGVDFKAIGDAMKANAEGDSLRGGSTITQQVARNAFLWQHRSWFRKGLEAGYTVLLEVLVPKERILEVYLNIAETGPMTFGMQAGAKHWYGKSASALTGDEGARLVAILPSPRRWQPTGDYAGKRARHIRANTVPFPGDQGFERAAAAAAPRVEPCALFTEGSK